MLAPPRISVSATTNGSPKTAFQTLRNKFHLGSALHLRHQYGEFIATQPSQHVDRTHLLPHAHRHRLQILVSNPVPIFAVDRLEPIQIHVDQTESIPRLLR